jgi:tRNA pseudouridine38-40 synthase
MRIALGVEYNGSNYCGWQSQPSLCGVQDALEAALKNIAGHSVRIHAAGRTDTGVHALMQVVHFDTEVNRPDSAWVRGVNAFLPDDISVVWSKVVEDDYHARFSATQRSYQYVLVNQTQAPAIQHGRIGWYHFPLSLKPMQEAAKFLLGEHDFSAFRASECQAKTPVRTITKADIRKIGPYFVFYFSANAFLQHQVRNMVGALIYVGNGKQQPESMLHLLQSKDRTQSPPTFSPNGLYLSGVQYDVKWQLPVTEQHLTFI